MDRTKLIYEKVYALTVNLFSRNRMLGQLQVSLNLEALTQNGAKIKHLRPRLVDSYNQQLTRFGQSILDTRRPLDLHRLETLLQRSTDNILGDDVATVLLYSAIINKP